MSKFESFKDLKIAALQRAGEITNGTSDYDEIVEEQMNNLLRSIFSGSNEFDVDLGEPWEWAKAEFSGILTLIPPFETGTASATQGSATVTLSTAPTGLGSLKGQYFRVTNKATIYRILTHTADSTTVVLDQVYLEDTNASATFKIIKLDYELISGVERLIGPMRCYQSNGADNATEISGIDLISFDRKYPRSSVLAGIPENFATVYESQGVMTVRFSHYQYEEKLRVEYDYIPVAAHLSVQTFLNAGVTTGTDLITIANHGFLDGQQVKLETEGTLPTGLSLDTIYYIVSATTNTFKLSASKAGTAIDITATSGGADDVHTISQMPPIPHSYRKVLSYAATHFVMVDKSDNRASYYMGLTTATLKAMVTANRKQKKHVSANRGRLMTRPDQVKVRREPKVFD